MFSSGLPCDYHGKLILCMRTTSGTLAVAEEISGWRTRVAFDATVYDIKVINKTHAARVRQPIDMLGKSFIPKIHLNIFTPVQHAVYGG